MKFFEVAVNTPFNNSILTYSSDLILKPGDLVEVPLGKRTEKGCVLKEVENYEEPEKIKEIKGRDESFFVINDLHLGFLSWVAKYYHYPLGQHIFDVLPKLLKRPRPFTPLIGQGEGFGYDLTEEQLTAFNKVNENLGKFNRYLLHGVTGSGKTTVYLKLFKEVLEKGQSCFFLIPEINLTPQFIEVFQRHLKGKILTYHSSMSNSEKLGVWETIQHLDEPFILIGVRSSVFLPFKKLGLIVVDEEHDTSFKQEDRCPYHARDVATKMASLMKCPIVLGSATPTVETITSFKGTSEHLVLKNRPKNLSMPTVEICDSRNKSTTEDQEAWPFNVKTLDRIKEKLVAKEQVLVFVNRLGFASFVQCRSCGHEFHCANCSSNLKYFKSKRVLKCQFCEYSLPYPDSCPECGNMKLVQKGFGTEKLIEVLTKYFPENKCERFDRDAVKTFDDLKNILTKFNNREIDLLVGTQMLSKGHDFAGVNLVVLLGVDGQLNFPDFRSNEKVFQLITQTAGRPGRSEKRGEVIIETLSPNNKIFDYITNYDQEGFYQEELIIRENLDLPPYSRMCAIYFSSARYDVVVQEATRAAELIKNFQSKHFNKVELLGPRPALIEKRANKFSWTLLVKSEDVGQLHNLVDNFQKYFKPPHNLALKVDIDPMSLA